MELREMIAALRLLNETNKSIPTPAGEKAVEALSQAIQEIKVYHKALNDSLPLLFADYGFNFYTGTDRWLKALAQHPDLGITMFLYEVMQARGILPPDDE